MYEWFNASIKISFLSMKALVHRRLYLPLVGTSWKDSKIAAKLFGECSGTGEGGESDKDDHSRGLRTSI